MRLWNVVAACGMVLLVLSCGSQDPGFGPYPSVFGFGQAGVAFSGHGGANGAAAAFAAGIECQPVGANQIGIVVFNLDNYTGESSGLTSPGPVSHDVVVLVSDLSGKPPRQLAAFTVPACGSKCVVLPCPEVGHFWVQDALLGTTSADNTDYMQARVQVNPDVSYQPCGSLAPVFIYRTPLKSWSVQYSNWMMPGGQGCPTAAIRQFLASINWPGPY